MQIFLSLTIAACSSTSNLALEDAGSDTGSPDVGDGGSTDAGCDPSITYASFGMSFFTSYCNRCHAWDQPMAQSSIGAEISYIAGQNMYMPPEAPFPTDAERLELVQWIACGAP